MTWVLLAPAPPPTNLAKIRMSMKPYSEASSSNPASKLRPIEPEQNSGQEVETHAPQGRTQNPRG